MVRYKFSKTENKQFAHVLRTRVKDYFQEHDLSTKGDYRLGIKTVIVMSIYIVPFLFILFGGLTNAWQIALLWAIMGLGKGFIGTSVMHDVLHGSYSKHKSVNALMHISALIVGVYPKNWKLQHNILHHTYTNIDHADDDLTPAGALRYSPNQDHKWFHKYQHIYAIFLYSLVTFAWAITKDFVKITKYKNIGLVKAGKEYQTQLGLIVLSKIFYFSIILGLPLMLVPIPAWQTLCMFLLMHLVTGVVLSLVFQPAHIVPSSQFHNPPEPYIDENWFVHQLQTTSNYANDNRFITWLFGGLNFQVEHHLFPHISHIHYPAIAKIVEQTTEEFGIPYYREKYFVGAVVRHFQMLRFLAKEPKLTTVPAAGA